MIRVLNSLTAREEPVWYCQLTLPFLASTLGVDIGSTSTRLVLLRASGDEVVVECDHFGDFSRYEPGDFPTSCYPFDGGNPYTGSDFDPNRIATSLKPVFLLLAPIDPEDLMPLIREYPDAEHLWSRINGEEPHHRRFKKNLKKAVVRFFEALREKTVETCKARSLRITSVGISVPAQWPAVVEDYIADTFLQKFFYGVIHVKGVRRGDIFFHSETQALAHYLLKHHSRNLMGPTSKEEAFLVADFGGQNLVSDIPPHLSLEEVHDTVTDCSTAAEHLNLPGADRPTARDGVLSDERVHRYTTSSESTTVHGFKNLTLILGSLP